MEQSKHPAKYQTEEEWQEAVRNRFNDLHTEIATLQAKCERYEKALEEILKQRDYYSVIDIADKALSVGEGKKEVVREDEVAKAWDEWRDSLVKHDNILVHHKERPEKYFEPFTFEEFKAVMLEKSPVFIYNTMHSNEKPLYQITSQFMPSGVEFFCTSWADKTPQRVTLEKFYHKLKMDGLEYAEF